MNENPNGEYLDDVAVPADGEDVSADGTAGAAARMDWYIVHT